MSNSLVSQVFFQLFLDCQIETHLQLWQEIDSFALPIKPLIVLEALPIEIVSKQFSQVRVVWLVFEPLLEDVFEVLVKFIGQALSKLSQDGVLHLVVFDLIVFLLFSGSLHALPRQTALEHVDHAVAYGLQVVSPALFVAHVHICRSKSCGSDETASLAELDVLKAELAFFWLLHVLAGQTQVNYEEHVLFLLGSY